MKRICSYFILLIALFVLAPGKVAAQMIAIRTDMLKDVLMTPSLGVDFVVGEKHTIGAEVAFNNQPWNMDMKLVSVTPEFRYWFNGRPFTRQYVGVVGNLSVYDMTFDHVYNGDALGLGLSFGHVWTLTKRLNIDLSAGIGVLGYRQKYYYKNDHPADYGERVNSKGHMLMPIKLGVSLVYVLR
ncbi:MAG: DUF3575 domain-containing protein [Bacteroidales bacterium]|nr:DUF3575 domain-containing protein [Bacteroidales bacterium]